MIKTEIIYGNKYYLTGKSTRYMSVRISSIKHLLSNLQPNVERVYYVIHSETKTKVVTSGVGNK